MNKEGGNLTIEDAQEVINQYFKTFRKLKEWLTETQQFISANGFIYSHFGRKRRLPNVFSSDKSIASHEVRSGVNATIQSLASDVNLLAAIAIDRELARKEIDAGIFMLVHDSIVVLCAEDRVEEVKQILKECTQRDRDCSIPGFPIGVDQEVGDDYSFGKFDKKYKLEDGMLCKITA